jgi:hypothetical protein
MDNLRVHWLLGLSGACRRSDRSLLAESATRSPGRREGGIDRSAGYARMGAVCLSMVCSCPRHSPESRRRLDVTRATGLHPPDRRSGLGTRWRASLYWASRSRDHASPRTRHKTDGTD